ncbi:MAG: biopolymer transporter ExbD [Rhodobacteraceae bacterium]|nr:biopolymer transporter ExbD [Paracoccaceae bacterium]
MALRKTFKRKPLSMTSLIDIIFLLLLFFMLSSTFSKFSEVDLPVAGQPTLAATTQSRAFLKLDSANASLNGRPVALADLRDAVIETKQDTELALIVSLGTQTTAQTLTDVLVALRGIAGLQMTLIGGGA